VLLDALADVVIDHSSSEGVIVPPPEENLHEFQHFMTIFNRMSSFFFKKQVQALTQMQELTRLQTMKDDLQRDLE
jgi:hypothetical protein